MNRLPLRITLQSGWGGDKRLAKNKKQANTHTNKIPHAKFQRAKITREIGDSTGVQHSLQKCR